MTKKQLTDTARWMAEHPDDVPPPRDPSSAAAWRLKRFGTANARAAARIERARYEEALAESPHRQKPQSA